MSVEPYTFADAERLQLGAFPVLDIILQRWARRIENTLFDATGIELYAGASVFEEMKFAAFYGALQRPRPIYTIAMAPFQGEGLLVLDNRFADLCLNARRGGRAAPRERLEPGNHTRLQAVVQQLTGDFDACWSDVETVSTQLLRLSTYPFRARLLNAHERCLVAQIHLSGDRISSRLTWCFPRLMLEGLLLGLRGRRVVPPLERSVPTGGAQPQHQTPEALLGRTVFRLRARAGVIAAQRLVHGLRVGQLIPLDDGPGAQATLLLGETPLLTGTIGDSAGRYAMKITGRYTESVPLPLAQAETFRPIRWPAASAP
ncbi:MAG: FliM/FliN family flagellar motor switch protein [Candidatus Lambdaproteobacteria bacterium]|nr:FliM/FliN family flagellar motor switch protein [Candidatus Lambdaproteobacteria bacterium]